MPASAVGDDSSESRRPNKRSRKAINCDPCRASKLKCDRNRPCSSCVLRGTTASCFQDGTDIGTSQLRGDDNDLRRIDPTHEIASLRNSINVLEEYIFPHRRSHTAESTGQAAQSATFRREEPLDHGTPHEDSGRALLANPGGGLYAGPTSTAVHLVVDETQNSDVHEQNFAPKETYSNPIHDYDRDLVNLLPPVATIDGLVNHYFENCTWIIRGVDHTAFMQGWDRFKSGQSPDRIVLATVCVIMAVAVLFLPRRHPLLDNIPETREELGQKYYDVMRSALQRYEAGPRGYTLELAELHIVRCHYQGQSKADSEEIWSAKSQLMSICIAMGLHRDPGKWKMSREVAERRRWIWWVTIMLDRWQAFLFGRPLTIASHHFDTTLPSYCDPALDQSEDFFTPNLAIFRFSFILGQIVDDAVSLRAVSYESILEHDRTLSQWHSSLPEELKLDEYRIARGLASSELADRRLAVQIRVIHLCFHHVRFTLHRPYASAAVGINSSRTSPSLEAAVTAADKVISLVAQTQPDYHANNSLAAPGYETSGPAHAFPAAMFFIFQLIGDPTQPGASLFRANIQKVITVCEQTQDMHLANKALDILKTLAPLYSSDFPLLSTEAKENQKASILAVVRTLAFPLHDSKFHRPSIGSPMSTQKSQEHSAHSGSPVIGSMQVQTPVSSIRDSLLDNHQPSSLDNYARSSSYTADDFSQSMFVTTSSSQDQPSMPHPAPPFTSPYNAFPEQQILPGTNFGNDEEMMWGASLGFGSGEWASFLDIMQPVAQ